MKMIRVISTKPAFRRAGRLWSGTTELPADELTATQIEQLRAEPLLVVQDFEQEEKAGAAPKTSVKPK